MASVLHRIAPQFSAAACALSVSPDGFQCKLNLPGRRLRGRNQPRVSDWTPCGIEDIAIIKGRGEIRVIQQVEKFRPELHIEGVGNSLDVVVFEYRKIEVYQSRADQCVPTKVAAQSDGIWH